MIRKHRLPSKLTAMIVSAVMIGTCLPSVAFAVEEDESKEKTATTQDAGEELEKAKKAEASAKKERDEAFAGKPAEMKKAYEDSKTAYNNAKSEFDKAESLLKTKTAENEKAKTAKTKIEGEIKKLKEEKKAASQKEKTLPSEIEKAEQTAADAGSKWKKDKEAADKAVREAQAASDAAGKEFINKKIKEQIKAASDPQQKKEAEAAEQKGSDLDAMTAACKTYTSVKIEPAVEVEGSKYATLAEIANSRDFEELVKRGCRYENLKKSVKYIKEANAHRNLAVHKAGELKVSYQLMGTAIVSGAIGAYQTQHGLLEGDKEKSFWKSGNSNSSAENLASAAVSADAGWDPFYGWYYEERIAALAEKDKKQIDQALIDQVLKESETNGYKYDPYKAPWNKSKENYIKDLKKETGHYRNLIDGKYKATGFAYIDGEEFMTGKLPYVAVQEFNTDTTSAVTVEEYEKALEEWFKPYLKPLETARANRKALDKEPEVLTKANETIKAKKKELETAKETIKDTEAGIKAKEKDLKKASAAAEKKQKELNKAQTSRDKRKSAMDKAKKTMSTNEGLNKKAQSLDPEKPSTYSDFSDLKKLVDAYEKAKKAREEAEGKTS